MPVFDDVVRAYVADPHFIRRTRLEQLVLEAIDDPGVRIALITGEPGAGKSALLSSLADQHSGWLRYFPRRGSVTRVMGSEAASLLLSIGHQLAAAQPRAFDPQRLEIAVTQRIKAVAAGGTATAIRIGDLQVSPFATTMFRIDQHADVVAGDMTTVSVRAATLEPRLLSTSVLQYFALIGPAEVLADHDPAARIVVLVDALDEAVGADEPNDIVAWLRELPELPPNVRIVAASRPEAALAGIRSRQKASLRELRIDSSTPGVRDDLTRYARNLLSRVPPSVIGSAVTAELRLGQLVERADGNFAYLAAFARGVDAAIAAAAGGGEQLGGLGRLLDFESFPAGLDDLYAVFIQSIHDEVADLPSLEVAEPDGSAEARLPAWKEVGARLLGVLSVARGPLTPEQLRRLGGIRVWPDDVASVLGYFLPFLDSSGDAFQWFHASIGEYLISAKAVADHPFLAVHAPRWHASITSAYRGGAASWASVQWSEVDDYGLNHLADHLLASGKRGGRGQLFELLSPGWMRERRRRAGSYGPFGEDAALAIRAAAQAPADIPQLVRCSLLYSTARSFAGRAGPEMAAAWARMGQLELAWPAASAIADGGLRADAYAMVAQELAETGAVEAAAQAGRAALLDAMQLGNAHARQDAVSYLAPLMARLALTDFALELLPMPGGLTALADGLADGGATWPGLTAPQLMQALTRLAGQLTDRLRQRAGQEGEPDTDDAIIAITRALGEHGLGSEGIALLEPLVSASPSPLRSVALALALAACGDQARAVQLAETVDTSWSTFTGSDGKPRKRVSLNEEALTTVARAFVRAGAVNRGLHLALELFEQGFTGAVRVICGDLTRAGDRSEAGRVALAALDRARSMLPVQDVGDGSFTGRVDRSTGSVTKEPARVHRDALLRSLAWPLARAGRPEADAAVAEIQDEATRQEALARLAAGQAAAGDFSHAAQSLARITGPQARDWATVDVIRARAAAGQPGEVMGLLAGVHEHQARIRALGMIALAQARAGNMAAAAELSGQLDAESEVPGDQENAAEALSVAARQLRDARPAQEALELVRRASSHAGRAIGACRAVGAMVASGHDLDEQLRDEVVGEVGQALDAGELDAADAVDALCSAGLTERARMLVGRVDPDGAGAVTIGRALAGAGDWAGAGEVVSHAADPAVRVSVSAALGVAQAARGMAGPARDHASSIRELADAPDRPGVGRWRVARALGEIACALASARAFDDAVTVAGWASEMRGEERTLHALVTQTWDARRASLNDPVGDAWQAIATEMGQSGRHEQASTLAAGLADVACRTAMLTALASVLTQAGDRAAPGVQASALELATTSFDQSLRLIPDDPFQPTPENPVTGFGPWRWALLLADLGRNAACLGDEPGARLAFDRACRAAGQDGRFHRDSWALTHVALRLAQAGYARMALEVTRWASQQAYEISDLTPTPPWRWQLIDRVGQVLAALGDLDDAVRVVDSIGDRAEQCIAVFDMVEAAAEVPGRDQRLAALVAVLSDLPGLSRQRTFGAVTRCASLMAAQDAGMLREACDWIVEVERWWPSLPHAASGRFSMTARYGPRSAPRYVAHGWSSSIPRHLSPARRRA
jgi:hypothetical protein